jgi:general secretion pathway protein A
MYQEFYGLRDIPFSLAPDPRYLFRTESLLEVFANLQYGIENGKGIVVVTGEVGCGKTTILRSMLQSLDRSVLAAYIFNPLLSTEEFFDLLAGEFRLKPQTSKAAMLRMLGHLLMARHEQGLRTVLVVDEAHLLPKHLLEEIRLLSNFETNRDKLLQIILCGQPELHDLLAQADLRQLKQRVSLKCSIKPLTAHETSEYIRWRLRIAGARNENLFEPAAIHQVHRFSGGIPRIVNNICDNALLTGFAQSLARLTPPIIETVVEELDLTAMEIISAPTVAETIIERRSQATNQNVANYTKQQTAPNVHYIRRDADDASFQTAQPPSSFVRQAPADSEAEAPLKFFSPYRVTKRA